MGDAPAHWRKSLKRVLFQLGFQQSALDPCVYKMFDGDQLCGLLVVEVDDLFGVGNKLFYQKMDMLRERFQFGKFVSLKEQTQGAAFNGRRIRQLKNGEFRIDMEKFVSERLQEVKLEVRRAGRPHEQAISEEKDATQAAVGSLTWAAKEGRPDAASLVASQLATLQVQRILDLNKCIRSVKKEAAMHIRIQPIPMDRLSWAVYTDASYANASKSRSGGCGPVGPDRWLREMQLTSLEER